MDKKIVRAFLAVALASAATPSWAGFNTLSASPNSLFVNTPTSVKFVADIEPDPKLLKQSVRLLQGSNGTFGLVGTMRDDGLGGDDVANDNRFTLVLNLSSSQTTALNFRASAGYSGTLQRVQSSLLALEVLPPVNLQVTAGQQEITFLAGESSATAFALSVSNQFGGLSNVSVQQSVSPSFGLGVITDLPVNGFSTNQQNQTFLVQSKFTGITPGDYTVTLSAILNAGGTSVAGSANIKLHVLPANGIGQISLAAYPGGLSSGVSAAIHFGASYGIGTAVPSLVQLFEVTAEGTPIQFLGEMKDDGIAPDIGASDLLYSVQPFLTGGASGTVRYFRAVAAFSSAGTASSPILPLKSLPYHIGFAPVNPASIVQEPTTKDELLCDQVIVVFQEGTTLAVVEAIVAGVGGAIVGTEPSINAYQISISCNGIQGVQAAIDALGANPVVVSAGPNGLSSISEFTPNDPQFSSQFAPKLVRANESWLITRGKGIVVAVIDTGVDYTHEDLAGRVTKSKDYINNDNDPQDDHSHGTHVAGIAAAKGHNSKGVAGMAWDANILAIKVCNSGGKCPETAQTSGILEATAKSKIMNMSLGGPKSLWEGLLNFVGKKTARHIAVEGAVGAGVMVVAASGNANTSTPHFPCAYPGVFCVGNSTSSDLRYADPKFGSNFGAHVDIAAPGVGILSTIPGNTYGTKTGTSMAAPLVAGTAALVWANNPTWTRSQVEERLLKTAVPLPSQQIGPRVDAFDAVFNGSFEHDLSGWKVTGTGSAVDKLGPINPTKDKRMGMASTGPDAAVTASELFQSFTIQPDVTELAISFSYAMITEEYPEWINRGFNDQFIVTLEAPGGAKHQLAIETVDGSSFTSIGGIDFPGGDTTVGWTGWKTVTSKKIAVTPGGGTFRLRVEDRGDGIYDTNGVLDHIRFR
jgi:subtilisin family serine protease